jgi:hypothetical protein
MCGATPKKDLMRIDAMGNGPPLDSAKLLKILTNLTFAVEVFFTWKTRWRPQSWNPTSVPVAIRSHLQLLNIGYLFKGLLVYRLC